ncbi:Pentatricopeptide repeat domain [Fragilaria crotonensis]|nr:Pentatricopeptide repeat domain [Fragilaria crotonensis]
MLLDDLNARYESSGKVETLQPDIGVYNAVIKAIAIQPGLIGAAEKAGSIVKTLEDERNIRPDVNTYNALVQACVASPADIVKAEQTLDRMILTGRPAPNERTYSIIIHALLATLGGTARAEAILDRMEQQFLPRASLYEQIIASWCEEAGMASRARQLLERMEVMFLTQGNNESLRPNRSLYNMVIQALEDQLETAAAAIVRTKREEMFGNAILYRKIRSNNQVFATLKEVGANLSGIGGAPSGNTSNFNYVLAQLADCGKIWAGLRAEDILNYMLELTFKRKNRDAAPNIITFNTVMAAWAKSEHALAGEKASELMKKLDDLHDMGLLEDVVADRVTYNTLMNAYAKSSDVPDSGPKAQECFEKLRRLYEETGDEMYKPDLISYSTLLSAWARSDDVGAAKTAEGILLRMHADYTADDANPKPNTACFNEVLYAWARSRDANASERAEMVLHLMEDMKNSGNSDVVPSTRTYNIVLLALSNSPDQDSPIRAMKLLDEMKRMSGSKPDAVSYNTAISAFTKKGLVNAALQMLEELFVRKDVVLDSKFFSTLIYSLAQTQASDAPIVAERILSDLLERQHIEVTTEICNALINCWGRSSSSDPYSRALRAEEILTEMLQGKFSLSAPPDEVTFTSVIDIWAKSGDPEAADRAEGVLSKMDGIAKPNVKTYTATIQAYARSQDRDKAKRAQELLQRMKRDFISGNQDAEPNIYVYNAVLNAAEFTVGNEAELEVAFQVACETFDEVRSSEGLKPDHVTYGTFMGVISQLMPESDIRNDMVQLVFRRCCADGQLAPVVMKKFKEAADTTQFVSLVGKGNITEANLPKEWTCNVRGARQ